MMLINRNNKTTEFVFPYEFLMFVINNDMTSDFDNFGAACLSILAF